LILSTASLKVFTLYKIPLAIFVALLKSEYFKENNVELDEITKESKKTINKSCYTTLVTELTKSEPSIVEEALSCQAWKDAMIEEYQSILQNDVWDIVPGPKDKTVVSLKWLYKIKYASNGSIEKHKARFVARGSSQKAGIDYEETFAPVARYIIQRTIIAITASKGWKIHQMNVRTAFLNGVINEEVYIEQPESFVIKDKCRVEISIKFTNTEIC
jgi:hypothetical protein